MLRRLSLLTALTFAGLGVSTAQAADDDFSIRVQFQNPITGAFAIGDEVTLTSGSPLCDGVLSPQITDHKGTVAWNDISCITCDPDWSFEVRINDNYAFTITSATCNNDYFRNFPWPPNPASGVGGGGTD